MLVCGTRLSSLHAAPWQELVMTMDLGSVIEGAGTGLCVCLRVQTWTCIPNLQAWLCMEPVFWHFYSRIILCKPVMIYFFKSLRENRVCQAWRS